MNLQGFKRKPVNLKGFKNITILFGIPLVAAGAIVTGFMTFSDGTIPNALRHDWNMCNSAPAFRPSADEKETLIRTDYYQSYYGVPVQRRYISHFTLSQDVKDKLDRWVSQRGASYLRSSDVERWLIDNGAKFHRADGPARIINWLAHGGAREIQESEEYWDHGCFSAKLHSSNDVSKIPGVKVAPPSP